MNSLQKRSVLALLVLFILVLSGCSAKEPVSTNTDKMSYTQISQDEAKDMMTKDDGHIVVDVRRQDEYDAGHIPGAILIPSESIGCDPPEALPDYDQIILIYCRSGNRSKQAAEKLAAMGYTNIYEFGGINTWTGEIVTSEEEMRQKVIIRIASNPTTGFSWEIEQDKELLDIQDEYIADPQDKPVTGAGGVQVFAMTPVAAGTVQVTFTYTRSWETSDADPAFTCVFEIDDEMQITMADSDTAHVEGTRYMPEIEVR